MLGLTSISAPTPTVPAAIMGDANESRIRGLGVNIRGVATAVLKTLGRCLLHHLPDDPAAVFMIGSLARFAVTEEYLCSWLAIFL